MVTKKYFSVIVYVALMISFFHMHAHVEQETGKNDGPGWGYYTFKGAAHALGSGLMFYSGTQRRKGSAKVVNKVQASVLLLQVLAFASSFSFVNSSKPSRKNTSFLNEKKTRLRLGVGLNVGSAILHFVADVLFEIAGTQSDRAYDCSRSQASAKDARNSAIKSLLNVCLGTVFHGLGWLANDHGASLMKEPRGMKVTVKMRGFDKKAGQEKTTLKDEMKKSRSSSNAHVQ